MTTALHYLARLPQPLPARGLRGGPAPEPRTRATMVQVAPAPPGRPVVREARGRAIARLIGFGLASLALHAALLGLPPAGSKAMPAASLPALSVELVAPATRAEPPAQPLLPAAVTRKVSPPPKRRPVRTQPPLPGSQNFREDPPAAETPPPLEQSLAASRAASSQAPELVGSRSEAAPRAPAAEDILRASVSELLLRDLARHFRYPALARRAGWQGTVHLAVTVAPDGELTDVRVTRSSGHAVLDRAAAETLRRVGRLAQAAPRLRGRTLELLLPVVYRLTD